MSFGRPPISKHPLPIARKRSVVDFETARDGIASMEIRGAGRIARAGARGLADAAAGYEGDPEGFADHVEDRARELLETRPTAVSLRNALDRVLRAARESDGTVGERVAAVEAAADGFVEASRDAVERIAAHAAARIGDGDVVLTHCNSQAALGGIVRARKEGREPRVYATESRPFRQGKITVEQLAEAGVDATLIVDSAVASVMGEVDAVYVGADTITAQGVVVNKIGTRMVALLARQHGVPFNVCAETYKFSPATLAGEPVPIETRPVEEVADPDELPDGVGIANPVFDETPPRHVDAIVTEVGVVHPAQAAWIIEEHLGGAGGL